MIKIPRDTLKTEMASLLKFIQTTHEMPPDVYEELYVRHKPVKDLCHTREFFALMGGFYISYLMDYTIHDVDLCMISRRVDEVTIYDDFMEYEGTRQKALSSVHPSKQTGLNLN